MAQQKQQHPRPREGYAFFSDHSANFREIPNDDWEIRMLDRDDIRGAKYVGSRVIDGSRCDVWLQRGGARYIAETAIGHNPIPTAGKVAIGAGLVALLAAIFWPKSASAATAPKPTPTPGTPNPTPPPSSDPPQQPPQQPPPPVPPASTTIPIGPDPSTFPTPSTPVAAKVAVFSGHASQNTWSSPVITDLDPTALVPLDLPALFAAIPNYKPVGPPDQYVEIFAYMNGTWSRVGAFNNFGYVAAEKYINKSLLNWSWVIVWRWDGTAWSQYNTTGPQRSVVSATQLATAIKDIKSPPYYFSQAYVLDATGRWVLGATSKNY